MSEELKNDLVECKTPDGFTYFINKNDLDAFEAKNAPVAVPKAPEEKEQIVRGTTKSGFNFSVDINDFYDMRVMELLGKVEADPTEITGLLDLVLGQEQKERLYKHCEDGKGRVSVEVCMSELEQIMAALGEDTKK